MNRAMRFLCLLAAAALVAGLLGCAPSTPALTPTSPSVSPSSGGAVVEIQGFAFIPPTVTIKAGETVTWTNKDGVPHDATFSDFMTGYISQGESFTRRFDKPGTYTYICKEHPAMPQAGVIVQ